MPFDRGPYLSVAAFCERALQDNEGVWPLIRIVDHLTVTAKV